MSYPYDQYISFKSEQSAVDPYSHISFEDSWVIGNKIIFRSDTFEVSNDYSIDEDHNIIFNSSREAYSQIEISRSAWESLSDEQRKSFNSLLFEYWKPKENTQPFYGLFHVGEYEQDLFAVLSSAEDPLEFELPCTLTRVNTYVYQPVIDPETGEIISLNPIVPCTIKTFIDNKENKDDTYIPFKAPFEVKVNEYPKPKVKYTHRTPDVYVYDRGTSFRVYWAIKVTTPSYEAREFISNGILEILPTQQRQIYSIEIKRPGTIVGSFTCSTTQQQTNIYHFTALITKVSSGPRPELCGMVEYQLKDALTGEDIENSGFFGGIQPIFSTVRGAALIVLQ